MIPGTRVSVKKLGVGAFCEEIDLLSLSAARFSPDALEKGLFGRVTDRGAKAIAVLVDSGQDRADIAPAAIKRRR